MAAAAATDITIALGSGTAVSIGSSANFAVSGDTYRGANSAYAKAAAINDANITSLSATASTSGTQTVGIFGGTALDTYSLSINGTAIYSAADVATALTVEAVRDAINGASADTGVVASVSGGDITLTAADGRDILVAESGTGFVCWYRWYYSYWR